MKKIDLNNLLAKYEKGNNAYTQPNFGQSRKQQQIEQSFYGKRTFQPEVISHPALRTMERNYEQSFKGRGQVIQYVGNFQMSKQQCQNFLVGVQNELKKKKQHIAYHTQIAFKQITESFNRNHESIRKQLLQLLDQAFRQNQRMMKQQLLKHANHEHIQFQEVKNEINKIDAQINMKLRQLSGSNYRKAISEVVLRDFSDVLARVDMQINKANSDYKDNLGQIEPDRARIQCLKNDLKSLFYFKKKTAKLLEKALFPITGQSPTRYDESKVQIVNQASRTRKSFFNFG